MITSFTAILELHEVAYYSVTTVYVIKVADIRNFQSGSKEVYNLPLITNASAVIFERDILLQENVMVKIVLVVPFK